MNKTSTWMPVAGDIVKTSDPNLSGQYRIKSIKRREKKAILFVPASIDLDGDTIFDDIAVDWNDLELVNTVNR